MSQIFISHSSKDTDFKNLFSNAFAGANVRAIYEEFEKILSKKITSMKVAKDIENSKAIFVILSQNVQDSSHTRDWVVWETGAAVAKNKDIWIFEPVSQFGNISIVTPHLRHYVIFDTSEPFFMYLRKIINSYDDSNVLPTVLATGGIGAAMAEKDKMGGAALGALAGLMIADKSKDRPVGTGIVCSNCNSIYNVHYPKAMKIFRCPVCNEFLEIEK